MNVAGVQTPRRIFQVAGGPILDLSHPIFASELAVSLPRLTPVSLAPVLELSGSLLARVADELTASCADDTLDRLDKLYGRATGKLVRSLVGSDTVLGGLDLTRSIAQAMCESLQTTGPSRTVLGRVILAHAERLINTRQGTHTFHADLQNEAEREAERGASRIKSMLPAYNQVVGSILEQSASELRRRSLTRSNHELLMFRGLRGGNVPTTVEDVSRTRYSMRPLASWSTTFEDAERFAHGANGVVVEALVPTGCLAISPGFAEEEILVFPVAVDDSEATKDLHEINIVRVHQFNN